MKWQPTLRFRRRAHDWRSDELIEHFEKAQRDQAARNLEREWRAKRKAKSPVPLASNVLRFGWPSS
jgi:hypothetical protein